MPPWIRFAAFVLLALAAGAGAGCGRLDDRAAPPLSVSGALPTVPPSVAAWPPGRWAWSWTAGATGPVGTAELLIAPDRTGGRWTWTPQGAAPPPGLSLLLVPARPDVWLPLQLPPDAAPGAWLPLPRLPVDSGHYDHLVALLVDLTTPRFAARVTHWPALPIPVRIGVARSGEVDLAACLRTALARWNEGQAEPWFACSDSADWGVRLVHLAGRRLSPPLWAQITRLDSLGAPLRVHIVCGDNYDDRRDSVYAVRGFVHELGHALFLWGHSPDRDHVLWAAAPPLRDTPSPDEEKAAQLWHGLPSGLDLNRYAPLIPP